MGGKNQWIGYDGEGAADGTQKVCLWCLGGWSDASLRWWNLEAEVGQVHLRPP